MLYSYLQKKIIMTIPWHCRVGVTSEIVHWGHNTTVFTIPATLRSAHLVTQQHTTLVFLLFVAHYSAHTIMVATLVYVKCARSDSYRRLRVTLSYRNVFIDGAAIRNHGHST